MRISRQFDTQNNHLLFLFFFVVSDNKFNLIGVRLAQRCSGFHCCLTTRRFLGGVFRFSIWLPLTVQKHAILLNWWLNMSECERMIVLLCWSCDEVLTCSMHYASPKASWDWLQNKQQYKATRNAKIIGKLHLMHSSKTILKVLQLIVLVWLQLRHSQQPSDRQPFTQANKYE